MVEYHVPACSVMSNVGLVHTTEPRYVMAAVLTTRKGCMWTVSHHRNSRTDLSIALIFLAKLAQLAPEVTRHVIIKSTMKAKEAHMSTKGSLRRNNQQHFLFKQWRFNSDLDRATSSCYNSYIHTRKGQSPLKFVSEWIKLSIMNELANVKASQLT